MTGILDKYLEEHGLTRYRLAKESGISAATWFHTNSRPLDRWTVKQVQALAACTGAESSKTLQKLEAIDHNKDELLTRGGTLTHRDVS